MSRLQTATSLLMAVMVLAAGLLASRTCEPADSTCSMGCGMKVSSGECCCHVDQQNSGSQPAKAGASVSPALPKYLTPSGAFTCVLTKALSSLGTVPRATAGSPLDRGGLAFLGVFLI